MQQTRSICFSFLALTRLVVLNVSFSAIANAQAEPPEQPKLYLPDRGFVEADPRPLPEERVVAGAIADIFDALITTMLDTRLEPDLQDLCWSVTNVFHRAGNRIQRELNDNEDAQKRHQQERDGSEVRF